MEQGTLVALIVALALAIVVGLALAAWRKRQQSAALREHFGPEYERLVAEHGDRTRAERELLARKKRLDELDIRPLSREQCDRYGQAWRDVQQRFVDDPSGAVIEADGLVKDVMRERGYPMGNFEQRIADLSVEHANVVDHYRAARALALANAQGQASTEDLRQAMVHYRALFNDLLEAHEEQRHSALHEARA